MRFRAVWSLLLACLLLMACGNPSTALPTIPVDTTPTIANSTPTNDTVTITLGAFDYDRANLEPALARFHERLHCLHFGLGRRTRPAIRIATRVCARARPAPVELKVAVQVGAAPTGAAGVLALHHVATGLVRIRTLDDGVAVGIHHRDQVDLARIQQSMLATQELLLVCHGCVYRSLVACLH